MTPPLACATARTVSDGRTGVRFDPRRQDYDPTPTSTPLGVDFEGALQRAPLEVYTRAHTRGCPLSARGARSRPD